MLGANSPEIATVSRDQRFELQPLSHGNQRCINQSQEVVHAQQLRAAGEVGGGKVFYENLSGRKRLDKQLFYPWAEAASDQIGSFRDYSGRCQQRLAFVREKIAQALVPCVVSIRQRVESAGVDQERHQARPRFRLLLVWGAKSRQRSSS